MRYFTKEWHRLMQSLGTAEMFKPVIDKEYSDEEFEELYQELKDQYIEEERASYDEPPVMFFDEDLDLMDEDFDPEDYIIGDFDEDGEEINLRHPSDLEELLAYQEAERERALYEYENREPFDEEEAASDFDENYSDYLEEPDEDVPQWIIDTVDPRLVALWALPEPAYRRLEAEERANQERFDELDEMAEDALEDMYADIPEDYIGIPDDLDELDGDYVIDLVRNGDELELVTSGWDGDGEPVRRTAYFEGVSIIEDEGVTIETETDEDGDVISGCDLEAHELYYEEGRFEVHMLFDDGELRYLTFTCDDISCEQSPMN